MLQRWRLLKKVNWTIYIYNIIKLLFLSIYIHIENMRLRQKEVEMKQKQKELDEGMYVCIAI